MDTTAFGWLWPGIPSHAHIRLDLLQMQGKKSERGSEGKMLSHHFIWLKEDLEAVRLSTADDGYCKIRGIRKFHQILTRPNKRNGVFIRVWISM